MTEPIDVAWVELRARGERIAARDVKKAVDDIKKDVDRASKEMDKDLTEAFASAASDIEKHLEKVSGVLDREATNQRRTLGAIGDALGDAVGKGVDEATDAIGRLGDGVDRELRVVEDHSRRAGKAIGKALGDGVDGGSLFADLAQIGGQLRGISALLPSPLIAALVAAVPAIIALGGALLDLSALILALPAAIAVLGASVAALKIAFSGVGDAISALASGDLDKINEAMKKLAPSAQAFAREIHALQKPLSEMKRTVQETFFAPLRGDLTALSRSLLPSVRHGLAEVSRAFGNLFSGLIELLGESDIVDVFQDIFASTARIVNRLAPSITRFLGVMFGVIEHGLPFVERAFAALGRGMDALSGFLSGTLKTGDFEDFLNTAFSLMKDLGALTKSVGRLLLALFGSAGDEGQNFIQTLTKLTDQMTEFLNSAEGQKAIQLLLDSLPVMMALLEASLPIIGSMVVGTVAMSEALKAIGGWAVTAGKAIGGFFQTLWGWITTAGSATGSFFSSVGSFFADLGRKIAGAFSAVVGFFGRAIAFIKSTPDLIRSALAALPGLVSHLFQVAFDKATFAIGFALGTAIKMMIEFPGKAWNALKSLVDLIRDVFTRARTAALNLVTDMVNRTISFSAQLPGRVWSAIRRVIDNIISVFNSARSAATSRAASLINSVVSFFAQLPGRAYSAIRNLPNQIIGVLNSIASRAFNVGWNIMVGVANGIRAGIGWVYDMARRAASNILQGMLSALGIGSPSKVFRDQVGKQIMAGVAIGIKEGSQEVRHVIDTATAGLLPSGRDGARTVTNTSDQSVVFGPGAVQVMFAGAMPTQEEARATGSAVGDSIAATLMRRRVRTAVRTA